MKPTQKAKEIYDKFLPLVRGSHLYDTWHNKAKECSKILCNEFIATVPYQDYKRNFIPL